MIDVNDEMVDAFWEAGSWWTDDVESPGTELLAEMIAAALAAAPTAEGWVWCDTCRAPQLFHVEDGDYECGRWSDESCGPYRTLLIGTEVKR
jgi:hypothetical protein